MTQAIVLNSEMVSDQNKHIEEAVKSNRRRLMDFIRRRIDDVNDAEDVLQDVFEEMTEAYRMMQPIEQIASWLMRVARNKIIDRYRKKKPVSLEDQSRNFGNAADDEPLFLADILPDPASLSSDKYDESIIWSAVEEALDELPKEQREVFIWHELEGKSFNEISGATGVSVNTLLSRKRYAVLHLREKLQDLHDEMFL